MFTRPRISAIGLGIVLWGLLSVLPLAAQTPSRVAASEPIDDKLSVHVLRDRVAIGEIGQIFVKVRDGEAIVPNRIDVTGLEVVYSGQQSSVNIVNGASTAETTYFYRFRGDEPGTYTIPEFEIRITDRRGERLAKTRPLVITVVENDGRDNADLDATKPYFGKLELVRDSFYVNELVPFTLTAYVRGRNSIHDIVSASLEHESFVIKGFREVRTDGAEVGNSYYSSAVIPSHLFALRPGTHRLGPAEIALRTLDSDRAFGGLPSAFFQRTVTREMVTNTVQVTVKALPPGAPASFTGGVGRFEMSATPSTTTLSVGDPVSMEFVVKGVGNLRTIGPPVLAVPPTGLWKTYDASKSLQDEEDSDGFREGTLRFSQVLIPEARVETIPEFQLSYFDPSKETYVTLSAGPFPITVTAQAPSASGSDEVSSLDEPLNQAARPVPNFDDVLHIRTSPARWIAAADVGRTSPLYWVVQALASVTFFTILGFGVFRWVAQSRQRRPVQPRVLTFAQALKRLPKAGATRRDFYHALAAAVEAWRREHPEASAQIAARLHPLSERCEAWLYSGRPDAETPVNPGEVDECLQILKSLPSR